MNARASTYRRKRGGRIGFTLIEVLATLVLLGIVLPVAIRGISLALASASDARRMTEAALLAEAKLDELVNEQQLLVSVQEGDFGAEYPGYLWSMHTASRDWGVREVLVRVTWQSRGQERDYVLATLMGPTTSFSDATETEEEAEP